jgi:hypothetical protein
MSSYENVQRKKKESLIAEFEGKPIKLSNTNKSYSTKPKNYYNSNKNYKEKLIKDFEGNSVPLANVRTSYYNSNGKMSIENIKRQAQMVNQPFVDKIRYNLGKCKDVSNKYNKLNDEFNYTIRIVTNMVTLIETNGKFLQQISEVLNDEMISNTEIAAMRNNHIQLVNEFKTVYNNLLDKNKQFIDPETLSKLEENIRNFEKASSV